MNNSIRSILFVLIFTLLTMFVPTFAETGKPADPFGCAYILLLGQTDDNGVGPGVSLDIERIKELFEQGIPQHRRAITVYVDEQVSKECIEQYFSRLSLTPMDAIVVYYIGHGNVNPRIANKLTNDSHFLNLKGQPFYRKEIVALMDATGARLKVLMTECCGALAREKHPMEPVFPEGEEIYNEVDQNVFFNLFFASSGWVNLTAAQAGEVVLTSRILGGPLTNSVCVLLQRGAWEIHSMDGPSTSGNTDSWDTFLERLPHQYAEAQTMLLSTAGINIPNAPDMRKANVRWGRHKVSMSPLTLRNSTTLNPESRRHPFGTLDFQYQLVPGMGLLIEDVAPFSAAQWCGLEPGDEIQAVCNGYFQGADIKNFSLDDCLLAFKPHPKAENFSHGRAVVHVKKKDSDELVDMIVSTRKESEQNFSVGMPEAYCNLTFRGRPTPPKVNSAKMAPNGSAVYTHISKLPWTHVEDIFAVKPLGSDTSLELPDTKEHNPDPDHPGNGLEFSPDLRIGVLQKGDTLSVFDLQKPTELTELPQHCRIVGFSNPSRSMLVYMMQDQILLLYDTQTMKVAAMFDVDGNVVTGKPKIRENEFGLDFDFGCGVSFNRDNSRMLVFNSTRLFVIDLKRFQRLAFFRSPQIADALLHPDGERFCVRYDEKRTKLAKVSLFKFQRNRVTEQRIFESERYDEEMGGPIFADFGFGFSPGGRYIMILEYGKMTVRDLHDPRKNYYIPNVREGRDRQYYAFSNDDRHLLTASCGYTNVIATLWELESGKKVQQFGQGDIGGVAVGFADQEKTVIAVDATGEIHTFLKTSTE